VGGQWMCVIILACCSMCMTRTKTVMWSSLPTQAKQNKPCLPWSPSCRSKCDIFSSKVVAYFLIICNFFSIKNKSQYSDVNKLQVWLCHIIVVAVHVHEQSHGPCRQCGNIHATSSFFSVQVDQIATWLWCWTRKKKTKYICWIPR